MAASAVVSLLPTRSYPPPLTHSSPIALRSSPFISISSLSLSSTFHPIIPSLSSSSSNLLITAATAAANEAASKKKVLIVNTNSGGHAVIGFYFAQQLLASGHSATVITVGDQTSDKMKKPPFTRFSELVSAGGQTVWGAPADIGKVVRGAEFDVVLDNNGKDIDAVKPVADWAKSAGVKQFLYVSSAGIYKTSDEVPHVEGDPVKGDASHVFVEKYIADLSFSSWAIFRPQYMIGSGNNKDCEEWFFDRIDTTYLIFSNFSV